MSTAEKTPFTLFAARAFWLMFGPLLLTVIAFAIATNSAGWLTAADILFFAVLALLILARWYEFHRGEPQTATGEPATPANFRRYVLTVLPLGLALWALANVLGNHLLPS